jgi:hypothetical protein
MYGFFTKTLVRLLGGTASFIAFSFAARHYSAQMIAKIFAISAVYGVVMAISISFTSYSQHSFMVQRKSMFWKEVLTHLPAVALTSLGLSILLQAYLMMSGIGIWMSIILGFTTFCAAFSLETTRIRWHKFLRTPFVSALGGLAATFIMVAFPPQNIGWALLVLLLPAYLPGLVDAVYLTVRGTTHNVLSRRIRFARSGELLSTFGFFSVIEHVAFNFPQIVLEKFDTSAAVSFGAGYRAFSASVSIFSFAWAQFNSRLITNSADQGETRSRRIAILVPLIVACAIMVTYVLGFEFVSKKEIGTWLTVLFVFLLFSHWGYYYRIRTAMMTDGHLIVRKVTRIGLSLILLGMVGLVNYPNAYFAVIFLSAYSMIIGWYARTGVQVSKARDVFATRGGMIDD